MMKLLVRYLRSRASGILLFILFAGIMAFSFSLYHLPVRAVLYPAVLCALLGLAALAVGFLRALRMHKLMMDGEPDEAWEYDEYDLPCCSVCMPCNGDMHSEEGVEIRSAGIEAYAEALAVVANHNFRVVM